VEFKPQLFDTRDRKKASYFGRYFLGFNSSRFFIILIFPAFHFAEFLPIRAINNFHKLKRINGEILRIRKNDRFLCNYGNEKI
jgi:hypothetical protein